MSENQPNNYQDKTESDVITSLIDEFSNPELEEEEFRNDFFKGFSGRRKKSAFSLGLIWMITVGLHWLSWSWIVISVIAVFITFHGFRLILSNPNPNKQNLSSAEIETGAITPKVSLLVSAKNEEPVIAKLVAMLSQLNYPQDKYEYWVINDNSSDRTGIILDELTQQYPQLKVLHRDNTAKGGKSGALNQVLPMTDGDIVGVFDADAIVDPDLLNKITPLFNDSQLGAIQVRKAISNSEDNFWTRGQSAEMALDSYFQQQRIACGGIGELRGNGQFVSRKALESCGGWNEETITDDLDLTIRLHLDNWNIGVLTHPAVQEEGVKKAIALWHQRSRWAEGGYQRYLDYWRFILSDRLNWKKKFDLFYFFLIQYIFPTAAIPDLLTSIVNRDLPLIAPLTTISIGIGLWGMFGGLKRTQSQEKLTFTQQLSLFIKSLFGMAYMTHWFLVMPFTTFRMSIRQKRLKWVKTVHEGSAEQLMNSQSS